MRMSFGVLVGLGFGLMVPPSARAESTDGSCRVVVDSNGTFGDDVNDPDCGERVDMAEDDPCPPGASGPTCAPGTHWEGDWWRWQEGGPGGGGRGGEPRDACRIKPADQCEKERQACSSYVHARHEDCRAKALERATERCMQGKTPAFYPAMPPMRACSVVSVCASSGSCVAEELCATMPTAKCLDAWARNATFNYAVSSEISVGHILGWGKETTVEVANSYSAGLDDACDQRLENELDRCDVGGTIGQGETLAMTVQGLAACLITCMP